MYKTYLTFILAAFSFFGLNAQESYDQLVAVGDTLYIGEPSSTKFEFIDVPRKNFIIKKGGIANMSSINHTPVLVSGIESNKWGKTIVTLKRMNSQKFFRAYSKLTAYLNDAVTSGELRFPEKVENELAK